MAAGPAEPNRVCFAPAVRCSQPGGLPTDQPAQEGAVPKPGGNPSWCCAALHTCCAAAATPSAAVGLVWRWRSAAAAAARSRRLPQANPLPCCTHCAPISQELDLSDNLLQEVPAWLPRACPRLRVLDVGFCGEEQGSYEDPAPLTLTPAVRELVTR